MDGGQKSFGLIVRPLMEPFVFLYERTILLIIVNNNIISRLLLLLLCYYCCYNFYNIHKFPPINQKIILPHRLMISTFFFFLHCPPSILFDDVNNTKYQGLRLKNVFLPSFGNLYVRLTESAEFERFLLLQEISTFTFTFLNIMIYCSTLDDVLHKIQQNN